MEEVREAIPPSDFTSFKSYFHKDFINVLHKLSCGDGFDKIPLVIRQSGEWWRRVPTNLAYRHPEF